MATEEAHSEEVTGEEQKEQLQAKNRVCDYYISARGCVKGDSCDFEHPLAPSGASTNRVCDFYGTARGCVKGGSCDFLHPRRINPRGEETNRVCEFFLTPQGCIKGQTCDFAHPRAMPSGGNSSRPVGPFGAPPALAGGRGVGRGAGPAMRVCEFYLTPAGCNRGNSCNFAHPTGRAAQQALAAKEAAAAGRGPRSAAMAGQQIAPICDYFFSRRGCSKGSACPFSHTAPAPASAAYGGYGQQHSAVAEQSKRPPKVCAFYNTEKGCVKGRQCDFLHVEDKVCDFYLSERGCKKGQHCNFKHVKDEQAAEAAGY